MTAKAKQTQAASARVKAMSHPLRAAALRHLHTHGTASPCEVAAALEEDVSNVSYHMRELAKLGCAELIALEPTGATVKRVYRAIQGHLIEAGDWESLPDAVKESNVVECGELAFGDLQTALQAGTVGRPDDEKWAVVRFPMRSLDRQGLEEVVAIAERAYYEAEEVPERAMKRIKESGETPIRVSYSQLAFEVPHF